MNLVLHLKVKNMNGVLERILGQIRYRGHKLLSIMAHPTREGGLEVTLNVESSGKGGNLSRHMQKLIDVESVEMYGQIKQARIV